LASRSFPSLMNWATCAFNSCSMPRIALSIRSLGVTKCLAG